MLVGGVLAGFGLLFPVHLLRTFYAVELPQKGLGFTIMIAVLGAAALVIFRAAALWAGRHQDAAGQGGGGDEPG